MKLAWVLALLVACTGAAYANTISGGGAAIPVEPYSFDGDNPSNVAVFMDQYPWGSDAVLQVLIQNGVPHTVYNSGSMGNIDLSPFDKVILTNNQVDTDYYYTLGDNQAWFESYMAGGGCMLMCCAAYFGYPNEQITWPGGFMTYSIDCINDVAIMDASHPVFNDPNPVTEGNLDGWSCSSHGSFTGLPDGAFVTLENVDFGPGTPAAFDFCWGAGGAYVLCQPIDWVGPTNPYTQNVVLYMCTENPSPTESTSWGSIKSLYK